MPSYASPAFLLASPDAALLGAIEPLLQAAGARVEVVLSAEAALASIASANPPGLVLLDVSLPGMPIGQLLAAARAQWRWPPFPHCSDCRHCDPGMDRPPGPGRH